VSRSADGDRGFVTATALLVVPALVFLSLVQALPVPVVAAHLEGRAAARAGRAAAHTAVEEAIALLAADPTPEGQSAYDPLWQETPPGVRVSEVLPRYAGGTGRLTYAHASTAPRSRLLQIAAGRLSPEVSPAAALAPVLAARAGGETLTPELLRHLLGEHHAALVPPITARPLVNANTADPRVLEALIAEHSPGSDPRRAVGRITRARAEGELHRAELAALLELPPEAAVFAVLGGRSVSLRLDIRRRGRRYEAVVLRVPGAGPADRLQVIRLAEVWR
jgi:hypothetical protein